MDIRQGNHWTARINSEITQAHNRQIPYQHKASQLRLMFKMVIQKSLTPAIAYSTSNPASFQAVVPPSIKATSSNPICFKR